MRIALGISLSHRLSGNIGSTVQIPEMMWLLKVWMARSALFLWWIPVGVS